MCELLFSVFSKVIFCLLKNVFVVVKTKSNKDITCRWGRVTHVNVFLLKHISAPPVNALLQRGANYLLR